MTELVIYPVKSGRGVSVPKAECSVWGLKSGQLADRHFLIVDEKSGRFITARQYPDLLQIQADVRGGQLQLKHDQHGRVIVDLAAVLKHNQITRAT